MSTEPINDLTTDEVREILDGIEPYEDERVTVGIDRDGKRWACGAAEIVATVDALRAERDARPTWEEVRAMVERAAYVAGERGARVRGIADTVITEARTPTDGGTDGRQPLFPRVFGEVLNERRRQDEKWGEQNHPSVDSVLLGRPQGCSAQRMCEEYEVPTEDRARWMVDTHAKRGDLTYAHILVEEVSEAIAAGVDSEEAVRAELVQVAAVAVAWIECIDRRAAGPGPESTPTDGGTDG